MIAEPVNDRACLQGVTAAVVAMVEAEDPAVVQVAERFDDTQDLAEWIRSLPQRDDLGAPGDGPKVAACEPPQRLRIPADDPNCVERAALYVAAAELIDPVPTRALTTIDVPAGRHTLPLEDSAPVVLDPRVSRNAARASLFRHGRLRNGAAPLAVTPAQAVDWIALLASEPAACFASGVDRVRSGHRAMHALLRGETITADEVGDVAFVLGLAHHESSLFGRAGRCIVGTTACALDGIDAETQGRTRNRLQIGRYSVRPNHDVLSRLGRVGTNVGYQAGLAALRIKLASLGIPPVLVAGLEHELNREGLSLGPLARPPMAGTLAAVTPGALAGRWVAGKL